MIDWTLHEIAEQIRDIDFAMLLTVRRTARSPAGR